jgi:hypothetical protein
VKIRFGRYRGWNVKDVPVCYLKWLRSKPGVSTELRECIAAQLAGKATPAVLHRRRPVFDGRMAATGDRDVRGPPAGNSGMGTGDG